MTIDWTRLRAKWPRRRVIGTGVTVVVLAVVMTIGWALNDPMPEPVVTVQGSDIPSQTNPGSLGATGTSVQQPGTGSAGTTSSPAVVGGGSGDGSEGEPAAGPATGTTPTGPNWLAAVDPLSKLLPTKLSGYAAGSTVQQSPDASRQFAPATASGIRRVTVTVHDAGTAAAAASFVLKVTQRAYPASPTTFRVSGGAGYAGTDSSGLAAAAFSRGRFSFEVLVSPEPARGADVRAEAIRIATGLEAAR